VIATLAAVVIAWLLAEGWFRMRRARVWIDGILAGRRSAELEHGWHQFVPGDPNPPVMPSPRRSPNEQFVWHPVEPERSPRPLLEHPR